MSTAFPRKEAASLMSDVAATIASPTESVSDSARRPYYGYVMLPIATVGLMMTAPAVTRQELLAALDRGRELLDGPST